MLVICNTCGEIQPWQPKGGPRLADKPCATCQRQDLRKMTGEEDRARRQAVIDALPKREIEPPRITPEERTAQALERIAGALERLAPAPIEPARAAIIGAAFLDTFSKLSPTQQRDPATVERAALEARANAPTGKAAA